MTRGEANKVIDMHLLEFTRLKLHCDEYGVPFYSIRDTGISIDIIFHDSQVGDISVDYFPVPPYDYETEQTAPLVDEMPQMWEGTV